MSSISRRDLLAGGASVLASAALPLPALAAPFEEIVPEIPWRTNVNVMMRQIGVITFHADGTETVVWSPVQWSPA